MEFAHRQGEVLDARLIVLKDAAAGQDDSGALAEFSAGYPASQIEVHAIDPDITPFAGLDDMRLILGRTVNPHSSSGWTIHVDRTDREKRRLRYYTRERRQEEPLACKFAAFHLPGEFHCDLGSGFGFQCKRTERCPHHRVCPFTGQGVEQVNGLFRRDGFAQAGRSVGDQTCGKGEKVDVLIVMTFAGILVHRDESRCIQQDAGVVMDVPDLGPAGDEERSQVTAVPAQGNIIAVRVGEGSRVFYFEWNPVFREVTPEGKFHRRARHGVPEMIIQIPVRAGG